LKIGDGDLYRERWEQAYVTQSGDIVSSLDPLSFTVVSALIVFPGPIAWLVFGVHVFYVGGFEPIWDEVDGPDPMGEIMRTA
jgi:hypothetical protein